MKRELSLPESESKRSKLSELHQLLSAENELEEVCSTMTRAIPVDSSTMSKHLTHTNANLTIACVKQQAVQMSMHILTEDSKINERALRYTKISNANQMNVHERYRNLVSSMHALNTTDDMEVCLMAQMSAITDECRLAANAIAQTRANGLAKMNMWKHVQQQVVRIRKAKAMEHIISNQ